MSFSWTQPVCEKCWEKEYGERVPTKLLSPEVECCALCGVPTSSGIYIRRDPQTVPYPAEKGD